MYRLISYEGKDGTNKLNRVSDIHSLEGEFYWMPLIGGSIGFKYNDGSGKLLHSSPIEEMVEEDDLLKIVTNNSIFVFKEV